VESNGLVHEDDPEEGEISPYPGHTVFRPPSLSNALVAKDL